MTEPRSRLRELLTRVAPARNVMSALALALF
jgi:hypothetical protein